MGALKDTMLFLAANDKLLSGADYEYVGFICAGTHPDLS